MKRCRITFDKAGTDLPDLKAARAFATSMIERMLAQEAALGVTKPDLGRAIEIRDDNGTIVMRVKFADVVDGSRDRQPAVSSLQ